MSQMTGADADALDAAAEQLTLAADELDASASAREALDLLLESGSATLVITNDGKPHGELGFDDLVAATASGSMSSRNDQ